MRKERAPTPEIFAVEPPSAAQLQKETDSERSSWQRRAICHKVFDHPPGLRLDRTHV